MRTIKAFNVAETEKYKAFWDRVDCDAWEPETFKIFDRFLKPDKSFIDIGAWIGVTALYGATKVKACYAFEPDRIAFQELITNINLNPSLQIFPFMSCVAPQDGFIELYSRTTFGDSQSSLTYSESSNKTVSHAMQLYRFLYDNNIQADVNFIKVDIEGGESLLLSSPSFKGILEPYKPTIYLSLHPYWFHDRMSGSDAVLAVCALYKHVLDSDFEPIVMADLERRMKYDDVSMLPSKFMEIILTDEDI